MTRQASTATLNDIALQAGVSVETVSRVLNRDRVASRRRDAIAREARIRSIAEKLDYRPNLAARATSTGRFSSVAMLSCAEQAQFVGGAMLIGAQQRLAEQGLHLVFERVSAASLADAAQLPLMLRSAATDGLLIHEINPFTPEMIQAIHAVGVPSVWLNSRRDVACTYADDQAGAEEATKRLVASGHARVAYATFRSGGDPHYSYFDRKAGYLKVMHEVGLSPCVVESPMREWFQVPGEAGIHDRFLKMLGQPDRPTAIMAYDLGGAAAAVVAAARLGLDVPRDLSIIGFGEEHQAVGMRVDMMSVPDLDIGRAAADLLAKGIENARKRLAPVVFPLRYTPAGTVIPPRG